MLRRCLLAAAVLCVSASQVLALEVVLHNRRRFVGEVQLGPKTVSVRVQKTTYRIPRGSVKAIRLFGEEKFEYEKRAVRLGTSAEAHFRFAAWLESKFQYAEAARFHEATLKLDPAHLGARKALGYRRTNGTWTLSEEDRWEIRSRWLGEEAADACVELAKIHHEKGEEEKLEPVLRRALIAWPRHGEALRMMRPVTDRYVSKNRYRLPVSGTWAVIHDYNNHHKKAAFMAYALDFMKVDDDFRPTRVPKPTHVEDYYTWDAPIHAAADGEVYSVNDGFPDSPLGRWTDFRSANTVCIRHAGGEYTVYGHLKNGSITVKKGQKVKAGDVIARGGNSGSSGWPHMHWAMYDRDGVGLPPTFIGLSEVTRDGEKRIEAGRVSENHIYRNDAPMGDAKAPK